MLSALFSVAITHSRTPRILPARVGGFHWLLLAGRWLPWGTPVIVRGRCMPARHSANFRVTIGLASAATVEPVHASARQAWEGKRMGCGDCGEPKRRHRTVVGGARLVLSTLFSVLVEKFTITLL